MDSAVPNGPPSLLAVVSCGMPAPITHPPTLRTDQNHASFYPPCHPPPLRTTLFPPPPPGLRLMQFVATRSPHAPTCFEQVAQHHRRPPTCANHPGVYSRGRPPPPTLIHPPTHLHEPPTTSFEPPFTGHPLIPTRLYPTPDIFFRPIEAHADPGSALYHPAPPPKPSPLAAVTPLCFQACSSTRRPWLAGCSWRRRPAGRTLTSSGATTRSRPRASPSGRSSGVTWARPPPAVLPSSSASPACLSLTLVGELSFICFNYINPRVDPGWGWRWVGT